MIDHTPIGSIFVGFKKSSAGVVPEVPIAIVRMRMEIRHRVIVFLQVHIDSDTDTPEMGPTGLFSRLLPDSPQSRHQNRQQYRNDCNNDKKFN
jgi:hypothetical protein